MKILFILPFDNTYRYKGSFTRTLSYAPLTLSVLAALVPKELKAEIKIVDEGVEKPCYDGEFDIVAITCVTSSAKRAYALCQLWRNKGSYVILGGVHPTLMPGEASLHADTIFIGLGENTFPAFLNDFISGKTKKIYRHEACCGNLSMPVARRDLASSAYLKIPTVLANRGCENRCSYCSIYPLLGNVGLTRPIGEVVDEIKSLKTKRIILLDPSPTSNESYAREFFKALIPLNIKWSGLSTIDIVKKPELFDLMVKSGCEGILTGFESINSENLISVSKQVNKVSDYKYAVNQFHKAGIPILGCFVAGFDEDSKESLLETVDFIEEAGIDLPRFSILTPFPGTEMYDLYEKCGRIITKDWDKYDTMHTVFEPLKMTSGQLSETFFQMWQKAYSTKRLLKRISNTRQDKILKLAANFGFKYYAGRLRRAGKQDGIKR